MNDAAELRNGYAIFFGEVRLLPALGNALAYLAHIVFSQLCAPVRGAFQAGCPTETENVHGVPRIFGRRDVLKVADVIILFVAVFMVDLFSFWAPTNESGCHKTVDSSSDALTVAVQRDVPVSSAVRTRLENATDYRAAASADAHDAAVVGYSVTSSIAGDVLPLFHDDNCIQLSANVKGSWA